MFKRSSFALLAMVLLFCVVVTGGCGGGGSSSSVEEDHRIDDDPIEVDPIDPPHGEVTEEMLKPDFWVALISDHDRVLATAQRIEAANKSIATTDGTEITDLDSVQDIPSVEFYPFGVDLYLDGVKQDETELLEMFNDNCIRLITPIYAVTTARTKMHHWPLAGKLSLSEDEDDVDYNMLHILEVNSPVITSEACVVEDEMFYWCQTQVGLGWISENDLALCQSIEEWHGSWKMSFEDNDFVVITDDKVDILHPDVTLGMGVRLRTIKGGYDVVDAFTVAAESEITAFVPVHDEYGYYGENVISIPQGSASNGFLPLTQANLLRVIFNQLGNMVEDGMDTGKLAKAVYACFGLNIPESALTQQFVRFYRDIPEEEKAALLTKLPAGTILYTMEGSCFMYIGTYDEIPYGVWAEDVPGSKVRVVPLDMESQGTTILQSITGYADISSL